MGAECDLLGRECQLRGIGKQLPVIDGQGVKAPCRRRPKRQELEAHCRSWRGVACQKRLSCAEEGDGAEVLDAAGGSLRAC